MNNKKNYLYTVNTIFILSILYLVLINILNIDNPIIDRNGFRQTQTAITSYYLFTDGISFKYMTPILGQPWSVPFEFPLYQFIVSYCLESPAISVSQLSAIDGLSSGFQMK